MLYYVEVHETLVKTFEVDAESPADAKQRFEESSEEDWDDPVVDCKNYSVEEITDEKGNTYYPEDL